MNRTHIMNAKIVVLLAAMGMAFALQHKVTHDAPQAIYDCTTCAEQPAPTLVKHRSVVTQHRFEGKDT